MTTRPTAWKPGQSGNPNGRPPGQRALTEILKRGGNKTVTNADGKRISRKRVIADMLWCLATTGEATFPDGKVLTFSPEDWLQVVKFIYTHVDGPPKQDLDITSNGDTLCVVIRGPADEGQSSDL